jgi:phosphoribosylamine--glycine ligase
LPPAKAGVHVFHAGTKRDASGQLVSSGGRVLAITGVADTLGAAQKLSGDAAAAVTLNGSHLRRDIGWREVARQSAGRSA